MIRSLLVTALFLAIGCGQAVPNYDGDYDVRVGTIDAATCTGSMSLSGDVGSWQCGTIGGDATLDTWHQGEVILTLQTMPNYFAQVRSKPGAVIAGPIVLGGESLAFIATKQPPTR